LRGSVCRRASAWRGGSCGVVRWTCRNAAGGVDEFGAGPVETDRGGAHRGCRPVGLFAELGVVWPVAVGGVVIAALGWRGDGGQVCCEVV